MVKRQKKSPKELAKNAEQQARQRVVNDEDIHFHDFEDDFDFENEDIYGRDYYDEEMIDRDEFYDKFYNEIEHLKGNRSPTQKIEKDKAG